MDILTTIIFGYFPTHCIGYYSVGNNIASLLARKPTIGCLISSTHRVYADSSCFGHVCLPGILISTNGKTIGKTVVHIIRMSISSRSVPFVKPFQYHFLVEPPRANRDPPARCRCGGWKKEPCQANWRCQVVR